jgi:magnesium transporter
MDAMYLSDKKNGIDRVTHDHEELEVLLESFSKQYEEIVNESENIEVGSYCKSHAGNPNSHFS